jgi:long-chain fatty acid transport protein
MYVSKAQSRARSPLALAVPFASALLVAGTAHATNGYFTHGIGTQNKAQAGAGTATPEQAIDAATNAAAGVLVGDRTDIGLAIFSPRREYSAGESQLNGQFGAFSLTEETVSSGSEWFPIPYIAKSWHLDEDRAFTALFYGRGGMNTDYTGGSATFDPDGPGPAPVMTLPGTFGAGNTGVNLNQAFLELGYAWRSGDFAFGIAPVIAFQTFEIEGVGSFGGFTKTFAASGGTQLPTKLSNNGTDFSWGYGLKAGVIWDVNDSLNLAVSYQSRTYMEEFSDYSDLFAQDGMFDIPAVTRIGASWKVNDFWTLHLDVDHAQFGEIESIAEPLSRVFNCPTAGQGGVNVENCFGGRKGAGFGWGDVTTYKLGATWRYPDSPFTFRAGYNYGEQPINTDDVVVNILAPATVEQHFTFGVGRKRANGHEVGLSLMYAPEKTISGQSAFDPTQTIELTMDQFEIEFYYSW